MNYLLSISLRDIQAENCLSPLFSFFIFTDLIEQPTRYLRSPKSTQKFYSVHVNLRPNQSIRVRGNVNSSFNLHYANMYKCPLKKRSEIT